MAQTCPQRGNCTHALPALLVILFKICLNFYFFYRKQRRLHSTGKIHKKTLIILVNKIVR